MSTIFLANTGVLTNAGLTGAVLSASTTTTLPGPTTTGPGAVITIDGGPNATANIVGPHNDPADLYGIGLGLVGILVAILITRLIFRRPRRPGTEVEGPR